MVKPDSLVEQINNYNLFLIFMTFYVTQQPFPNVILCFSWWCKNDITSETFTAVSTQLSSFEKVHVSSVTVIDMANNQSLSQQPHCAVTDWLTDKLYILPVIT